MAHYFDREQDSDLRITTIESTLRGNNFRFLTGSGVFSVGRVDKGSLLLIERCAIPEEGRVLDLGCGFGVIGIAIARAFPKTGVILSDVNERAVMLAGKNIGMNKAENAVAVRGDGYENVEGKFDVILLNPPQSAGKELCLRLMKEAKGHLAKGGSLQAVMRHKVGGKDMSEKTAPFYRSLDILAIKGGYRVYRFNL